MSLPDSKILGHAPESDGIEEFDNPLPDWWVGLFFITIVWGVWYGLDYHHFRPTSQAAAYDAEVALAQQTWPELYAAAEQDVSAEALALGEQAYATTCVACHGADLRGGIGVNLIDDEWVHGGSFDAIVTTISDGVGAKGMPAWGPLLGPKKVAAIATYVLSKAGDDAPAAAPGSAPAAPAGPISGAQIFTQHCVACHMADLTGGVGPNLVDDTWIHGGTLADIRSTIETGVPEKGMITWKGILTAPQIEAVAIYIHEAGGGE